MAPSTKPWQTPHKRYRLINAQLIDPKDAKVYQNCSIDIAEGIIKRLSRESGATAVHKEMLLWSISENIHLIDLEGKFVIPGLIDCHVNLGLPPGEADLQGNLSLDLYSLVLRQAWLAKQMLDRGFTSIRDCGGANTALKRALEEGLHLGPRLFTCGRLITQTGGHGDGRALAPGQTTTSGSGYVSSTARIADGVDQCLQAAREELRQGADYIMISTGNVVLTNTVSSLVYTSDEIRALTTVATNAGTYVSALACDTAAVLDAISHGVKAIDNGGSLDQQTAKLMADKQVVLVPTLTLAIAVQDVAYPDSPDPKPNRLQAGCQAVKLASDAGVTIAFGTGVFGEHHSHQSQEFGLRKQAGQTAVQILQAATINGATLLRQEKKLGRIKEGYAADLLILTASPLDNIEVLGNPDKHILAVLKDGRILTSRWSKLRTEAAEAASTIQ